jgi:hypothetical protein
MGPSKKDSAPCSQVGPRTGKDVYVPVSFLKLDPSASSRQNLKVMVEWMSFLLRIQEVPRSNLGSHTACPHRPFNPSFRLSVQMPDQYIVFL